MLRKLVTAAAAAALVLSGADTTEAVCHGNVALARHTMLLHATTVDSFSTTYARPNPRELLTASGDINHPYSPGWFAAGNNPAFSVHVALRYSIGAAAGAGDLAPVYLFSYRTAQAMTLEDCDDAASAMAHTLATTAHASAAGDLAALDQPRTGWHFCNHHAAANAQHGYTVRSDTVRHEQEYIICHAHDETWVEWAGRTRCRIRATATPGHPHPTLWANCGDNVNGGRWYTWNLNNGMAAFQDAAAAVPPAMIEVEQGKGGGGGGGGTTLQPPVKRQKTTKDMYVKLAKKKTAGPTVTHTKSEKELFKAAAAYLAKEWPLKGYAGPASNPK